MNQVMQVNHIKLFSFILFLLLAVLPGCKDPIEPRPNILLIVADDLGYEKLGCYGNVDDITPNLDEMAMKGTLFTRAYTSPVCTPSRMSIYTGTYAPRHKYNTVLPVHLGSKEFVDFKKRITYAQLLKNEGYLTAVTGKWQLAALEFYPQHCQDAGFDSWFVWQIWHNNEKTTRHWNSTYNHDGQIRKDIDSRFGPDVMTEYVINHMKQAKKSNKPFCIQHNMVLPHIPIIQTPEDKDLNRDGSLDNMISYMDTQIGILLDSLHAMKLAGNTLVIFAGDNGTDTEEPRHTRSGIVTGGKGLLNDGGTHVPLIAYWPGKVEPNKEANDLIDFADIFPTLCDLAGVTIPEDLSLDGISFTDPLLGRGAGQRKWITAAYLDDFIVYNGKWRLYHKDNKLVDCRNLPDEKRVDINSEEAKMVFSELLPILNRLRDL
jgi:arylsulfatase A